MQELENELELDDVAIEDQVLEAFFIDNLAKCEWYIRKVNAKRNELGRVKANATNLISQLENQLERFETMFEGQFKQEIVKHIPEGKKSLKTFYGVAQFKTVKAGIEIVDKVAIPMQYMQEFTTFKPSMDALKKAVLEDGESVPGVESRPEEQRLYINE